MDFALPSTDGATLSLRDIAGPQGTLIMFICNHCPYVTAVQDRLVSEAKAMQELGIGVAAICSNDAETYPEDSFEKMLTFARVAGFTFPYLHDESQQTARAYDAACTPDFFGFNSRLELQYRGRLDDAGRGAAHAGTQRDLFLAMEQISRTDRGPKSQIASMGCSIKWKSAA